MASSRDIFDGLNPEGILAPEGHGISASGVGWGEPQTIFSNCLCGWAGITVEEEYPGYGPLIPELHPFVDRYGQAAIYLGKAVGGNWDTVARQCLEHLTAANALSLEELQLAQRDAIRGVLDQLASDSAEAVVDAGARISELSGDLELVLLAQKIVATVEMPQLTPVTPEIVAEYQEILARKYPRSE